jgi:hypothetical protein
MFLRNRNVEKVSDPLFSRNEREDYPMCDTRYLAVQSESLVPTGPVSLLAANRLMLLAFVIFAFVHIQGGPKADVSHLIPAPSGPF